MPQTRRRYAADRNIRAVAEVPGGLIGGSVGALVRAQVTNEHDRKPVISSLLSSPAYLKQKIKDVKSKTLRRTEESYGKGSTKKASGSQSIEKETLTLAQNRAGIKEEIIKNLRLYRDYEKNVRSSDDYATTHRKFRSEKILRAALNPTTLDEGAKGKKSIEKELNVRGRRNTFEKIIVQHAALVKMYNDTFSNEASRLIPGTKEAREYAQFTAALQAINKQLESPDVTLDNRDLDKLHSLTKTRVDKLEMRERATFSTMNANIIIDSIQSNTTHADPVKTGTDFSFSLTISGVVGAEVANGIASQASDHIANTDSSAEEADRAALQEEVNEAIHWAIDAGVAAGIKLDISIRDSAIKFTRISTIDEARAGLNIGESIGIGGRAELLAGEHTVLKDRMGTNSFYYPQYQFNGLASAGTVDASGLTEDSWSKLAYEHRGEITSMVKKVSDPTSRPSKYLDSLIHGKESIYGEKKLAEMNTAIKNLKENSQAIARAEESHGELSADPAFKEAVDNLRSIFSIYSKTVITKAKAPHKKLIINEKALR